MKRAPKISIKDNYTREIILVGSKIFNEFPDVKSLIVSEIYFTPFALDFSAINALIFTSKTAIEALINNKSSTKEEWIHIPSYVIGISSARYLEERGGNIAYIGKDSHGNNFAKEIIPLLKNKKALYVRAKKTFSNLSEQLFNNKIYLKEIIVYENRVKKISQKLAPKDNSILIFAAPSYYHAFLQNFKWNGSYIAIAIGMSTFSVFDNFVEGFISPKQSIKSCVEFAKELIDRYP